MSNFYSTVTRTTTFQFPPRELYLYGSRYHSLQRQDSDWDYACSVCPLFKQELSLLGFKEKELERYRDCLTDSVWEGSWEGEKIQVGFKTDLERFKKVWKAIDFFTYSELFYKESAKRLTSEQIALVINLLDQSLNTVKLDLSNLLVYQDRIGDVRVNVEGVAF